VQRQQEAGLEGKIAIITGASRGIGKQAALRVALNGTVRAGLIPSNPGRWPECRRWPGPGRRYGLPR
jgi:hypothetical protein